jgi:hypothetical protein
MEINDNVDFLVLNFFVALSFPISAIPCHFHLLCICTSIHVDEDLQVLILLDVFMGIVWDAPTTTRFNAQDL